MEVIGYNKEKFAELVMLAKGPSRTVQQFANDLGVSPSTLSRIINMKNKSPSSMKLLKSIVEKADRNSNVNLDDLMNCNGMINKLLPLTRDNSLVEEKMSDFINVIKRSEIEIDNEYHNWAPKDYYKVDLALETKNKIWAIDYQLGESISFVPTGCSKTNFWILKAMGILYDNSKVMKISSLIEKRILFQQIGSRISGLNTDRPISVIYVSQKGDSIMEICSLNQKGITWNAEKWNYTEADDDRKG